MAAVEGGSGVAASLRAFVDNVAEQPSVFFMPDEEVADQCRAVIKATFDDAKREELKHGLMPLPELYVAGFDTDQIWAELELQHAPLLSFAERAVRKLLKRPHKVTLPVPESDSEDSDDAAAASDAGSAAGSDAGTADAAGAGSDSEGEGAGGGAKSGSDSEGEDGAGRGDGDGGDGAGSDGSSADGGGEEKFFSLEDMENFAALDGEAEAGIGEDINLMAPVDDSNDTGEDPYRGPTYEDMFGSGGKGSRGRGRSSSGAGGEGGDSDDDGSLPELDQGFNAGAGGGVGGGDSGGDDDEEDVDLSTLTPYEREQRQVREKIKELEAEALAPKPWTLTGEVKSGQRPENSLLETVMEYDQAQPAAPEVTVESTAALEEVIKQRVRDELWDDVERKVPEDMLNKKQQELPEVSLEKSKLGLGEIYAKEYLKQTQTGDEPDEKQGLRDEIQGLFTELCGRLDALSNFNFTPKPVVPDMAVRPNAPAISMEEVIPTAVSDAHLQAPEEVYRKKRGREGVVVGDDELSREEKKRRRRARKAAKSKRHRANEATRKLVAKLNPGLGNKYAKEAMLKDLNRGAASGNVVKATAAAAGSAGGAAFKSAQFFSKLQEQVSNEVRGVTQASNKPKKAGNSSAAFKL